MDRTPVCVNDFCRRMWEWNTSSSSSSSASSSSSPPSSSVEASTDSCKLLRTEFTNTPTNPEETAGDAGRKRRNQNTLTAHEVHLTGKCQDDDNRARKGHHNTKFFVRGIDFLQEILLIQRQDKHKLQAVHRDEFPLRGCARIMGGSRSGKGTSTTEYQDVVRCSVQV